MIKSKKPDLLAGLDAWLENMDSPAPPADLRKPEIAKYPMHTDSGGDSLVSKPLVTSLVTTIAAVCKQEISGEVSAEKTPSAPDAWTDAEAELCMAQLRAFEAKGIPSTTAEAVACRLVQRDRQLDDRRSCAECASFYGARCLQRKEPFGGGGVLVLHRCNGFKLTEAKND